MNASDIAIFLGRFHPLVVHLPIGFLMMAFLMWAWQKLRKSENFDKAIAFCLLLGALSAVAACVIGYLLSTSGGYAYDMLDSHMWAGIVTTILAFVGFILFNDRIKDSIPKSTVGIVLSLMMVGLSVTGHIGGSLTHGSTYLTEYAPIIGERANQLPPPKNIEEAELFGHIIKPILKAKCQSCHSESKLKGGLSLATNEAILKGGDSGSFFITEAGESSDFIKRIHLEEMDEDVMPPKGKSKLTENEKTLLSYWVEQGGSFEGLISLSSNDTIEHLSSIFLGFSSSEHEGTSVSSLNPVDSLVLQGLRNSGIMIRELAAGTYRYDVKIPSSLIKIKEIGEWIADLQPISENVMWLNLANVSLKDEQVRTLLTMKNLTKLRLEKNLITDVSIDDLSGLKNLQSINLYGNKLTNECLKSLEKFENLEKAFVWKTNITKEEAGQVQLIM
ncbi:MAG: hypothetical protein JXR07_12535 [Reichenbachiella sp.]